ncbi:hypothetical protein ACP70R_044664 [Stipagrostis hirtigluma subsp. patula]
MQPGRCIDVSRSSSSSGRNGRRLATLDLVSCCQAQIPLGWASFDVRLKWLDGNMSMSPAYVLVAKEDWYNDAVDYAITSSIADRYRGGSRGAGMSDLALGGRTAHHVRSSQARVGNAPTELQPRESARVGPAPAGTRIGATVAYVKTVYQRVGQQRRLPSASANAST